MPSSLFALAIQRLSVRSHTIAAGFLAAALLLLALPPAPATAQEAPEEQTAPASATAQQIQEFAQRVRAESMRKHNEYGGAYIEVNGQVLLDYYTCPWSRLFIAVIDRDGKPAPVEQFILVDRKNCEKYTEQIIQLIGKMQPGDFIVMAVHDSINQQFNENGGNSILPSLQSAFAHVGVATDLAKLDPKTPYIAIGMKGAAPGEAVEIVGQGDGLETGAGTVRHPNLSYEQRAANVPFWTVTVKDQETGQPVAGAHVVVQQTREFFEFETDENGQVTFHWVAWSPKVLAITAEAPGKAKIERRWKNIFASEPLPWRFDIELPEGASLGGQVVDADGNPVAKAFLFLGVHQDVRTDGTPYPYVNDYQPIHADEDGRWQVDQAPAAWLNGHITFSKPGWGVTRTQLSITPELH